MNIILSASARRELEEIFEYLQSHDQQAVVEPLQRRIRAVLDRLQQWPESSPRVTQQTDIRVAPLIQFPYRIFYRITDDTVEIVHVSHTSRRPLV
jgi:plasmid stabilization system protein ParE